MIFRVGVLLDRPVISAWEGATIARVADSDVAQISLVMVDRHDGNNHPANSLLKLYMNLDQRLFKCRPDAIQKSNVREILPGIPFIELSSAGRSGSNGLLDDDLDRIRTYNLDLILHLGSRVLEGDVLELPKYGVWSFTHGDPNHFREGPPGFWELAEDSPVVRSVLEILTAEPGKKETLVCSYSRTHPLSLAKGRNVSLWKCVAFVPRKLRELSKTRGEMFFRKVEKDSELLRFNDRRGYDHPTLWYMVCFMVRQAWRVLLAWIDKRLSVEQWFLAFSFGKRLTTSFWEYETIRPPKDRFWADPHLIRFGEEWYIFLEEYLYSTKRGHISVMKIGEDGQTTPPVVVLERDYHLSYPFVFFWNGTHYMVPETSRNKTIDLYECVKFPDQWELKLTLMKDVRAVDATLLYFKNKWWLFTNIAEHGGAETTDELFLFHADELLTQAWTPHPLNPIVSDVRRARPAGRIFEQDGVLYRPSQDCSREYGGGINFHQIVTLTEEDYREVQLSSHKPDWDEKIIGLHTFSQNQELTVIDLCMKKSRWK